MTDAPEMIRSPGMTEFRPHDRVTDESNTWYATTQAATPLAGQAVVLHVHDVRADQFVVWGDQTVADQPDHADYPAADPVVEVAFIAELDALYGSQWHDWAAETIRRGGRGPSDEVRAPPTYFTPASRLRHVDRLSPCGPDAEPLGPPPRPRWQEELV